MCNLQCNGFGQLNPTDPTSWELPFETFDVSKVKRVEDLPVWDKGCDSSYTWAKKYKHLMGQETPPVLAQKLIDALKNKDNPDGLFLHPVSKQHQHLCFTGGEPLMPQSQQATIGIWEELQRQNNLPGSMTFETNGTQIIRDELETYIKHYPRKEFFFSVSPKIFNTSGEKDAVKPEIVKQYWELSQQGQLKFVCNGTDESWEEIENAIQSFRDVGVRYPIWIMPVGALEETQQENAALIAEQTMDRGYNVSARVHCYIWGNQIGT